MAFERKKRKDRPPVSGELRRLPGQSVRDELDKILNDDVAAYLAVVVTVALLAGWEWFRLLSHLPPQPIVITIVAVAVICFCTLRITKARKDIRMLAQGEKGERRISELLRPLRAKNYVTFDDLITNQGNVDHVVVGPGGVFAIETKAYNVFGAGRASVRENGRLMLNAKEAIGDPLKQARSSAALVSEELERHLRRKFWVQSVLILPGWKIDSPSHETDVVVLSDKTIPEFFSSRPLKLNNAEIREICAHLDRSARS
jgi:hypothetical protein